jgi:hypothetical protein
MVTKILNLKLADYCFAALKTTKRVSIKGDYGYYVNGKINVIWVLINSDLMKAHAKNSFLRSD